MAMKKTLLILLVSFTFEVIDPKAGFFYICSQKVGREEAIMF